ncbi:TonB-dependent receptor [Pedobacter glucosidilyticus]|uniref:TonB-dependent receptor n=1 Tax=Pedobacter glucosidilyticus TaxID=1122941 RepID=UPI0026F1EDD7|nr:TonB-dependent receptor [Pedobacter glucosidilyticus]
MKLALIILITAFLQTSQASFAQKVSLDEKGTSLEQVIKKVRKQSGYSFIYQDKLLQLSKPVNVEFNDLSINDALKRVFEEQPLTYIIKDRTIIIQKKATSMTIQQDPFIKIKGKVVDENGLPIIGASITQKGTKSGTLTNASGEFTLSITKGSFIMISYLGYANKEVQINDDKVLNIVLLPDATGLNEVVVVGYGTQNRKDVTTSVSSLSADQINNFPAAGLDKALTGRLAGVQVLQPAGAPGAGISILVRGTGSITSGSDPLYVVDGVPLSDNSSNGPGIRINPLNFINVNDIESIDILKDASAAAIYGSRGSNGVVLITTKKGKSSKTAFNIDSYYGTQSTTRKIPMLDAYQYSKLIYDAHNNTYFDLLADRGLTGSATDDNATRLSKFGAPANNTTNAYLLPPEIFPYLNNEPGLTNTDWQDEIFQSAPMQSHTISASGGSEKIKYYVSGNYLDQEGIVINSGYKKYGGRINLDVTQKKFHFGTNFTYNYAVYNYQQTEGRFSFENVVSGALAASPYFPVYNPDGTYNYDAFKNQYAVANGINPVALANLKPDRTNENKFLTNVFAEYDILKDLKFRVSFGADISNANRDIFRRSELPSAIAIIPPSIPIGEYRSVQSINLLAENTITYNKTFGNHSIRTLAGFSVQKERNGASQIVGTGYANNIIQTLNAATSVTAFSSNINEWSLLSLLGRVQYSFKNKYLLSAALRADGSSRFGPNNKYGYFPSASAGWIVKEENFMQNVNAISSLKLRASYGVTGNFQIGNYGYLSTISPANYVFGASPTLSTGLFQSTAGNPDLGWEKTTAVNLGLDFGLFKDALRATIDVYNNNTSDLLLDVPVPQVSGFSTNLVNIGKVNNRGIEITLSNSSKIGKLTLTNNINYSSNRNKVVDLGGVNSIVTIAESVLNFITEVGKPVGNYYTLVQTGIFKDQADIDNPANATVPGAKPGDFKFKDVDGNGVINSNDREITGNYLPKFTYGYSGQLQYGAFDLNVAIQGVYGNTIANINQRHYNSGESFANNTTDVLNAWKSPEQPGNGTVARANRSQRGLNSTISTYHLEDGSYLRVRDITLGAKLPTKHIQKAGFSNVRLYFTAQNAFTFTKYNGYNPEASLNSGALTPGIDYGSYPIAKAFILGLNLNF